MKILLAYISLRRILFLRRFSTGLLDWSFFVAFESELGSTVFGLEEISCASAC